MAVYEFATSTFEKLVTFDISSIENPISQIIFTIANEYISALPEWLIEDIIKSGALKLSDSVDMPWILRAASLSLIDGVQKEGLIQAMNLISSPAQRFVGKQIGKKLAGSIAIIIAASITKKLLVQSIEIPVLKRRLVRIRQAARKLKGGLGGALLTLLNSQGLLGIAADSSRQLEIDLPRLWRLLRFQLNGANMVYFLLEDMMSEYLDRLSLLENNPKEFGLVILALAKEKKTRQIFFPSPMD